MLGTQRGRSHRLPTPPTPSGVVSLHSDDNPTPKTQKSFRGGAVVRGASEIASVTRHERHEKDTRGPRDRDERERVAAGSRSRGRSRVDLGI